MCKIRSVLLVLFSRVIRRVSIERKILVTGGTGSFGTAFVRDALRNPGVEKIIVYSRDEIKQWQMQQQFADPRLRFFIGDVRDVQRLSRAMHGVTHVVHAAATKIVPTAEYNPFEAVKTNILGATHVIDAALDSGVKRVVALSTDKASSPINLYGATKLVSDKLFVSANNYAGARDIRFAVVRYGNVMGSRGSLVPFLMSLPKGSSVPLTHPSMTRFMITLDQAVSLVNLALDEMVGGEIFVKKIPSMMVTDIIQTLRPDLPVEIVGVRPGEKMHEQMIGPEEDRHTFDFGDHFRILAETLGAERFSSLKGDPVEPGFTYTSDSNSEWMSPAMLRAWVASSEESTKLA